METIKTWPSSIYIVFIVAFIISGLLWFIWADLSINLIAEMIGAILTVIVINILLSREKMVKWKIVRDKINYLISRTLYGIKTDILNILSFNVVFKSQGIKDEEEFKKELERYTEEKEYEKLEEIKTLDDDKLMRQLDDRILEGHYGELFKHRADEILRYILMRYADHLEPETVKHLIELYDGLEGLDKHIKIYRKGRNFPNSRAIYEKIGKEGVAYNIRKIAESLLQLKKLGYVKVPEKS